MSQIRLKETAWLSRAFRLFYRVGSAKDGEICYTILMRSADSSEARGSNAPTQNSHLPEQTGGIRRSIGRTIWKLFGGKEENHTEKKDPLLPEQLTGMEILRWAQENGIGQEDIKPAGTLIEQGEPASSVYVLLDGAARIEHTLDEEQYYLATLPPESVIGEISALTDSKTTAAVSLLRPTRVLEISAAEFKLIADDPVLKERVESMISKRLLVTADFRERLRIYLDEKEAERMNATPNTEMEKELSLAEAIKDGLSEDHPIHHDFNLSYMVGNKLGTKKMDVVFTKLQSTGGYSVAITSDGVSISMKFSEDGKTGKELSGTINDGRGSGIYTRILRYLLRDVQYMHSSIIEDNTMEFVRANRRDIEKVSSSELAANSPVTAARKGFISNINNMGGLTSYRVDPVLTLILDVATDVERSFLYDENDARLIRLYGTSMDETLNQLTDMMTEYQNSDDYRALPDEARHFCNLQIDRIQKLPDEIRSDRRFHS